MGVFIEEGRKEGNCCGCWRKLNSTGVASSRLSVAAVRGRGEVVMAIWIQGWLAGLRGV